MTMAAGDASTRGAPTTTGDVNTHGAGTGPRLAVNREPGMAAGEASSERAAKRADAGG
jgi:ribose 5-phosphate isomerase RpiB